MPITGSTGPDTILKQVVQKRMLNRTYMFIIIYNKYTKSKTKKLGVDCVCCYFVKKRMKENECFGSRYYKEVNGLENV